MILSPARNYTLLILKYMVYVLPNAWNILGQVKMLYALKPRALVRLPCTCLHLMMAGIRFRYHS